MGRQTAYEHTSKIKQVHQRSTKHCVKQTNQLLYIFYTTTRQSKKNCKDRGRSPCMEDKLNMYYIDNEASNYWITTVGMFSETEGFLLSIQDHLISLADFLMRIGVEKFRNKMSFNVHMYDIGNKIILEYFVMSSSILYCKYCTAY